MTSDRVCFDHPGGHEYAPSLWRVSTKGETWEVAAHCQLEAWDLCFADRSAGWFMDNVGLIATANLAEGAEGGEYAIHSVGLLLRYGFEELATIADEHAFAAIGARVITDYRERGAAWIL